MWHLRLSLKNRLGVHDFMMKRAFGNTITRLLWGGTTLNPVEHQLLERLVAELPTPIRMVAEQQLYACNLVQREADGRALNFGSARSPDRLTRGTRYFNGGRFWQIPSDAVSDGESITDAICRVLSRYELRPKCIWAGEHA